MFGRQHSDVALNLNNLGTVLQLGGKPAAALDFFRESLAIYGRSVGEKHANYATVSVNVAKALRESGQIAEAEQAFRAAEARVDSTKQRLQFLNIQIGLGRLLAGRGAVAEARPRLERALARARAQYGESHWRTAEAKLALGGVLAGDDARARGDSLLLQSL